MKPKSTLRSFLLLACSSLLAAPLVQAQTTLTSDGFEGSLGSWTAGAGASLYTYVSGTNHATTGNGAARVSTSVGAANTKTLTLTNTLPLASLGLTSVTITFDYKWFTVGTATRWITVETSNDGGATWTAQGGNFTANTSAIGASRTVSTGLTDQFLFRFKGKDDTSSTIEAYIDNVVITAAPTITPLYWDLNGTTAGSGGTAPANTWDAAATHWNPATDGTGTTAAWTPGATAIFSAGSDATNAYTIAVDGTQSIGGLAFEDGTVTLSGGTALQMASATTVGVLSGLTATIATPLSDVGVMSKNGSGKLVLSGNNSAATGGIALNTGALQFESPNSINGTLENVTINGSGAIVFGPSFGAGNIPTALADRIVTTSAGTIAADNYAATNFDFATPALSSAYLGAVSNVTYTGLHTPATAGTYRLGGGGGTLTLADTSGMSGNLAMDIKGNVTISGNIETGTGTLTKSNTGFLTLTGANTYSGLTTVSGGRLILAGSNSSAGNTVLTLNQLHLASASNGGLPTGTLTFGNANQFSAVIQAVDADRSISNNVVLNNTHGSISGDHSLTVNGTFTNSGGDRTLTNGVVPGKALTLAGEVRLSEHATTGRTLAIIGTGLTNISGNIVNGATGAGGLTAGTASGGTVKLSGTNTYSGKTINAFSAATQGSLIFQGIQALPDSTMLQQTHAGGVGGFGTIKILDDAASPASRSTVNLAMLASNTSHTMTLFVGNNNTANGGSSSGTTTGSTISLGNLNLTQNVAGNTSQSLSVTGADNYRLQINQVDLPGLVASSTAYTVNLAPSSAPLTVAGNVQQKVGNAAGTMTLALAGTAAGNLITGNILDSADGTPKALSLTKTNAASVWTLTGTNTYTGATTVSGGTLLVNSPGSLAGGSAVAVNGTSTLGGSGMIGGTVIVAAGANLAPGASAGTLSIGGGLDISAMAGGAGLLKYELGSIAASDRIAVTGSLSIGTDVLNFGDFQFTDLGGLQNGTYKLITSGAAPIGTLDPVSANLTGPVGSGTGVLQITGNDLELVVSGFGPDTTPPTLVSIGDNQGGGPVTVGTQVIYTVSFSEDIDGSTVSSADFSNAGSSTFTIGAINETSPGVFTVQVTPTSVGTLILQIPDTASVTDLAGLPLDSDPALVDNTTINVTVADPYAAWSEGAAFGADANNDGVENGLAWLLGAANPDANATGLLPTASQNGGLVLTFSMLNTANRGTAVVNLQHSNDLGISDAWASVLVPETSGSAGGVTFTVTADGNFNDVVATIPAAEALSGKLFGRVKAVSAP